MEYGDKLDIMLDGGLVFSWGGGGGGGGGMTGNSQHHSGHRWSNHGCVNNLPVIVITYTDGVTMVV